MKLLKNIIGVFALLVLLNSCENNDPTIVKIFVRSASNELVVGAKVIIIADLQTDPNNGEFVDTLVTNNSGYVAFDISDYFAGEPESVTFFDITVKTSSKIGTGYIRSRVHNTAVETVYLPN